MLFSKEIITGSRCRIFIVQLFLYSLSYFKLKQNALSIVDRYIAKSKQQQKRKHQISELDSQFFRYGSSKGDLKKMIKVWITENNPKSYGLVWNVEGEKERTF